MKRCPTCQRTYEGGLKFCQVDGTPLIDDNAESDLDPMKTMIGVPPDLPTPSPFGDSSSKRSSDLSAPSFGDLGSPQPQASNDFTPNNQASSGNFGSAPQYKEPDPPFGNQAGYNQSPFGNQQAEWSAPPAPQEWQNQGLGQNTPFNAPPIQAGGQNQTLPIVSLVTGIISVCCYISPLTGLVALITGYLALKNIKNDPAQYGGRGLAIAGMIVGGIFFALGILYWLYVIVIIGLAVGGGLQ